MSALSQELQAACAVVEETLAETGLEWEPGAQPHEYVVTLPGEHKQRTVLSLLVRERGLSVSAFVVRNADENHEAFYRYLLRRNLRMPGLAYAIDASGDVYVTGRLPLPAVTPAELDRLLGVVLTAADDAFDDLLLLGFLTSMRREWRWRLSRGESTRNLEAFRHVLEREDERPGDGP